MLRELGIGAKKEGIGTEVVCQQGKETRAIPEQGRQRCPSSFLRSLSDPTLLVTLCLPSLGGSSHRGTGRRHSCRMGRPPLERRLRDALSIQRAVRLTLDRLGTSGRRFWQS